MLQKTSGLAARRIPSRAPAAAATIALSALLALACGSADEPTALSLIERFEPALDACRERRPAPRFSW